MAEVAKAVANYLWHVLLNLYEAIIRWFDDDASLLAAGVAFYATISLVPLLLVLIAGFSLFLRYTSLGLDAELNLLVAIEDATSSEVANAVSIALEQVQEQSAVGGPLGLAGLVLAAMAVFTRFDRALEKIWKTERRKKVNLWATAWELALHRIKAFATLLGLGLVVMTIFGAGMALSALSKFTESRFPIWEWIWHATEVGLSITLNAGVFALVYRLLGRSKIDGPRALRGGLLAAITWEAGRLILAEFLIDDRYTAYGIVGSLLVVMLWAYYATSVLLLGAEYVQVIREREQPRRDPGLVAAQPDASLQPATTCGSTRLEAPQEAPQVALNALRIAQMERGFGHWRPGQRRPGQRRRTAA